MKKKRVDLLPLDEYDVIAVALSGGKDSIACYTHLYELGVPADKIECWHHDVDGGDQFMDWPCTPGYCRAFADAFGSPLYMSWREGGFRREMLREGTATAPVHFETPGGVTMVTGGKGPPGTRRKFPQVSADLKVRWCSAYLKIDVGRRVISNDPRLKKAKILLVTGERREESTARSKYLDVELHASANKKRLVHQWRPVLDWTEQQVWDAMKRMRVVPHPCYRLGWGRCSCMTCIFGNHDQWASAAKVAPRMFTAVGAYESQFNLTIHRKLNIVERADKGSAYNMKPELMTLAMSTSYDHPILVPEGEEWQLPAGAFSECGGPT